MTTATKTQDIKRAWHLVDIQDKTLGRTCSDIAKLLMGKSKSYFVRNLDCGDYVVVINAKGVKTTGNKDLQKKYYRYSGYPGGLSIRSLQEMRNKKPTEVIVHAVKGMLPQNRLRDRMLKRLFVFADENHPYGDKLKDQKSNLKNTKEEK